MRFYRVHQYEPQNGSNGYVFFASKREAMRTARAWMKQSNDEEGGYDATIDIIVVRTTKVGLLNALNRWAGHADNG